MSHYIIPVTYYYNKKKTCLLFFNKKSWYRWKENW